jgi:hypothetical protein
MHWMIWMLPAILADSLSICSCQGIKYWSGEELEITVREGFEPSVPF